MNFTELIVNIKLKKNEIYKYSMMKYNNKNQCKFYAGDNSKNIKV